MCQFYSVWLRVNVGTGPFLLRCLTYLQTQNLSGLFISRLRAVACYCSRYKGIRSAQTWPATVLLQTLLGFSQNLCHMFNITLHLLSFLEFAENGRACEMTRDLFF